MRARMLGALVGAGLIAGAGAIFYLSQQDAAPEPQTQTQVETPPAPAVQAEPAVRYPLPVQADAPAGPLPALGESDQTIQEALYNLLGRELIRQFFQSEAAVRHIVATIDNLPRQTVAARLLPVKAVEGGFLVAREGDKLAIDPANDARYAPYVRIAEKVDAKQLVDVYVHFYPLFQRAYQELGYPKAYFNDRLIAVIDHLLAAPEVEGKVELVQPHVLYQFADADLEHASAGHKIMLRMGSRNAEKLKAKLQEIRREVVARAVQQ